MELSLTGSMHLLPGLYLEMRSKCGGDMSDVQARKQASGLEEGGWQLV